MGELQSQKVDTVGWGTNGIRVNDVKSTKINRKFLEFKKIKKIKTLMWHYETRNFKRWPWVHFLVALYCWPCSLTTRVVWCLSETPLEESASDYQLEIVSVPGMEACSTSAFISRPPSGAELCNSSFCLSRCACIWALVLFICRPCCLGVLNPLWLLHSFHLLILGFHEPKGSHLMETTQVGLNIPSSLILYIMSGYGLCMQEETFLIMAEQGTDLWIEQNIIWSNFSTTFFFLF